jgi:hypothetical protein
VQRDDEAVRTTAEGRLVVVLGYEAVDGVRQLGGERGPVSGVGEPDLAVDPEGRQRLAGRARSVDQLADFADQAPRDRKQPARRTPVRLTRRVRRESRQSARIAPLGGHLRIASIQS